ncbi:MAG: molybdenum cofactor biosynthesis protein MoaE [Rhodothermales bacterium]|nr:molybdenum cofactor biosynthesis protein MoaE [Rhodothermales bacterium]
MSHERKTEEEWVRVQERPLDVSALEAFLRHPRAGGVCVFVGTTRAVTGSVVTEELRYEAFSEMALDEMKRLAAEASVRWPVLRAALHHRTGVVPVAEASVAVGVATPHRADSFEACRFLIDRLKETVPVWKKEIYADGSTEWVEPGKTDQG